MSKVKSFCARISLFIFFLTVPSALFANFDFNANCLKAYQNIFDLKLATAKALIANEKKVNPKNSIIPLLENYVDYFHLLTTESKIDFDQMKENKSQRLDQIEKDDKNSPYYLYAQAEINLQWALIRGRYGEFFTAAREIKRANSLLQENVKKFPGFHLNSKGLGLINAVLGNLPDGMLKSTLATFGIKGNTQVGMNMLENLADNLPKSTYEPFYEEVVFYYVFTMNDIVHSPDAYQKTMKYTARMADSCLLKAFLQAVVCAKNGHNAEAIQILQNRPSGSYYTAFPYLDLLMGTAMLNKLDLSAGIYFNRFLQQNKGVNYIKDANLHLGWLSLLKGDTGAYSAFMSKVKINGYQYQEKDKQALNEANAPIPDLALLKARLLFDGGYYSKGLAVLSERKAEDFHAGKDRTEYYYRLGRLYDDLGKDDVALTNYQLAITNGKQLKYYFAANAALQMGKMYEKQKNILKAKESFNAAIQMKNHEYESSIETQAKAGLNRIK